MMRNLLLLVATAALAPAIATAQAAGGSGDLFATPGLFVDPQRLFSANGVFTFAFTVPPSSPTAPMTTVQPTTNGGAAILSFGNVPTAVGNFRPPPIRGRVPGDILVIQPGGPPTVVVTPGVVPVPATGLATGAGGAAAVGRAR